jgi:uncharacterized protein YbjT (DUF2867 family)
MKIVVIGGSGLIGSKLIKRFQDRGHEAVAASPDTGVDTLTGAGLAEALNDASVVVDVSNSPSFADEAVMKFFQTSTRNLLAAEAAAGVGHHVALAIVGAEQLPDSGYLRAKVAQEKLIEQSSIPYSIVRSTQFFEFVKGIAEAATGSDRVVRTPAAIGWISAAEDVADAVASVALALPLNGTIEIGGPEKIPFDAFVRRGLHAYKDPREVVVEEHARYFGTELAERSLVAGNAARLGRVRYDQWLAQINA